jgi:GAF domain-containing protein
VASLSERFTLTAELEATLQEAVDQIQQNFGYYHAHIYLLDQAADRLVVAAGTGPAGAELKMGGHSIDLQASSLVARAARTREIVSVEDVQQSPDWLPNPLLPDTRSEMAVPVMVEGRVMGVLDVQQNSVAGLDHADATLLRLVANQIAASIRNARLFNEVETALAQAREAQERYLRQSWAKTKATANTRQYLYSQPTAPPLDEERQQIMVKAQRKAAGQNQLVVAEAGDVGGAAVVAPVIHQNTAIGTVQLHSANRDRAWSDDDLAMLEAITDQFAQSAENLRLFEETRQRADYERLVGEITQKVRQAPNLEALSRTATEAISKALGVSHAGVSFDLTLPPAQAEKGNGHVK